jgi:hypothetical protein
MTTGEGENGHGNHRMQENTNAVRRQHFHKKSSLVVKQGVRRRFGFVSRIQGAGGSFDCNHSGHAQNWSSTTRTPILRHLAAIRAVKIQPEDANLG